MRSYLKAVVRHGELLYLERGQDGPDTVYFGGGTPSLAPPEAIAKLISLLPDSLREVTLEANPEQVTPELVSSWLDCGITRISLGIQCLDDGALVVLGRRHTAATALAALETLVTRKGLSVSVDLLLGVPGRESRTFLDDLKHILEFRPHHLSLYMLEKAGRLERLLDADLQADEYLAAHEVLTDSGYIHYEISNFCLAGHQSIHNMKYWLRYPVDAIGAGAWGNRGRKRWRNVADIPRYVEMIGAGLDPVDFSEELDETEELKEKVILAFRTFEGVELDAVKKARSISPRFSETLDVFLERGLAREHGGRLRLTAKGWLLCGELLMWLS